MKGGRGRSCPQAPVLLAKRYKGMIYMYPLNKQIDCRLYATFNTYYTFVE